jgi:hypothetical protein
MRAEFCLLRAYRTAEAGRIERLSPRLARAVG